MPQALKCKQIIFDFSVKLPEEDFGKILSKTRFTYDTGINIEAVYQMLHAIYGKADYEVVSM